MTPQSKRAAQRVLREWCAANGVAMEPLAAADLVRRIAEAMEQSR
jgi:hypothetical protein